ncbi:MAG: bifunctional 4-hydroxy-3-methylbut-2-enyl diphosphate reductase/30S ribosomal protein S1 [Peptoniphilaceae bacterium]|nr:bifunctional 4-hydroxy-3-methylbut-2-enyl diphosphate reductase/30S ribosomal protein S1 [Peptoniphilaceae bacterium]
MKIKIAENLGFCFGVKNAVGKAYEALNNSKFKEVYCLGEIVHNKQQVEELEKLGMKTIDEEDIDTIENSIIIVRAHGVADKIKQKIQKKNKLVDGTCPVLLAIYKQIHLYEEKGYTTIIIGDKNHPEIKAMESFSENSIIVTDEMQAKTITDRRKLFVVSQTTNKADFFNNISNIIRKNNDDVVIKNTICNATRKRQSSCEELSKQVDCMVVVGGFNSSNTNKLFQIADANCKMVFRIETVNDLPLQNLSNFNTIGVIAGASTPDSVIEEVVGSMDNFTSEDFMNSIEDSMKKVYPREIVKGKIIEVKDDELFVDIQYRSDGIVKLDEMTEEQKENPKEHFSIGDEIDVYVIKLDDGEGNVSLSTRRVEGLKSWKQLEEAFENEELVEGEVTGFNKGGLNVKVNGLNGFIPASHVATYFVKNFKKYVGETWKLKVLSVDERKRRLVLSRKDVMEDEIDNEWNNLHEGDIVKGTVARLTDFGAFVEIGALDGLLHVSDIAWTRVEDPADILKVGEELEVKVLKLNKEKNRISLCLKQITEKPFEKFVKDHEIGDVVKGKVVNLLAFGAFVELADGVEGLIHVSEISWFHVEKPSDELNIGDEIEVKIISVDSERERIGLSLKAMKEQPEKPKQAPRKPRVTKQVAKKKDDSFGDDALQNNLGLFIEQQLEESKNNEN